MKKDKFEKTRAESYDLNNQHLKPLLENLHYLIRIVLKKAPSKSKVLCVGVGTGEEVLFLAKSFPDFSFVACDPSESMLEVCKEKLERENILDRCELIHGHLQDIPHEDKFDVALCLLVFHHTSKDEREKILKQISFHLLSTGIFIEAEISWDTSINSFNEMMENWQELSRLSGASEEKINSLPRLMLDHLSIKSEEEIETLFAKHGLTRPLRFFQSLFIHAWYAKKTTSVLK